MVRCSVRNAASSASRDRKAMNPPNGSPAAERTGAARPTRCSPRTAVAIASPESAPALNAPARTDRSAVARSSRGRVLPVTTGGRALSAGNAKNTTSEFVASPIAVARESSRPNAATSTPCGAASGRSRSGVATATNRRMFAESRSSMKAPWACSPDSPVAIRAPRERSRSYSSG